MAYLKFSGLILYHIYLSSLIFIYTLPLLPKLLILCRIDRNVTLVVSLCRLMKERWVVKHVYTPNVITCNVRSPPLKKTHLVLDVTRNLVEVISTSTQPEIVQKNLLTPWGQNLRLSQKNLLTVPNFNLKSYGWCAFLLRHPIFGTAYQKTSRMHILLTFLDINLRPYFLNEFLKLNLIDFLPF